MHHIYTKLKRTPSELFVTIFGRKNRLNRPGSFAKRIWTETQTDTHTETNTHTLTHTHTHTDIPGILSPKVIRIQCVNEMNRYKSHFF